MERWASAKIWPGEGKVLVFGWEVMYALISIIMEGTTGHAISRLTSFFSTALRVDSTPPLPLL
jgi:hypothetical protein